MARRCKLCMRMYSVVIFPNIIGILVSIFIMSNVFLLHILLERHPISSELIQTKNSSLNELRSMYFTNLHKYFTRINGEWRVSTFHEKHFNSSMLDKVPNYEERFLEELTCSSLSQVENMSFVATGWTKVSFKIRFKNKTMVLKTVNNEGHDVSDCLNKRKGSNKDCYLNSASKILKEIVTLKTIIHNNIIKVLGYCVPDTNDSRLVVSLITEVGDPIDIIKLLQMSWEDRLRISLGLARLLNHFSNSPLGPILMNDFRRQQFVLMDGELKLIDVDDISIKDPSCETEHCCITSINVKKNAPICIPCVYGKCEGYNEKLNVLNTGKHFINFILPHGAPLKLVPLVDKIVHAYSEALWNASQFLKETQHLTNVFIKGQYRNKSLKKYLIGYKILQGSDLPEQYDYRCKLTVSGYGCTLSVFDAEEAAAICTSDPDCKAFVLTNVLTWTGRKMTHFKNGIGKPIKNVQTALYIKTLA